MFTIDKCDECGMMFEHGVNEDEKVCSECLNREYEAHMKHMNREYEGSKF